MVKKSNKINQIVNKLKTSLQARGISVDKLILFGSYAQGKQKPYSDIDIAVVSSSFNGKNLLKRQEILGEAIFPLKEPIEALGYTPKEIRRPNALSFLSEIISTGRIVYKKAS
ncbi:MAG: nucleotidyltransferase domain-containing protein [Candidatus Omnitrophota bacterium]